MEIKKIKDWIKNDFESKSGDTVYVIEIRKPNCVAKYLTKSGKWTEDFYKAWYFETIEAAISVKVILNLKEAEVHGHMFM